MGKWHWVESAENGGGGGGVGVLEYWKMYTHTHTRHICYINQAVTQEVLFFFSPNPLTQLCNGNLPPFNPVAISLAKSSPKSLQVIQAQIAAGEDRGEGSLLRPCLPVSVCVCTIVCACLFSLVEARCWRLCCITVT